MVLNSLSLHRGRRVIGISGHWSGQKPWWNWYLTPAVNFGEVRRAQLAKSTLLSSSLVPPGIFSDLLRFVLMIKREWVQKARGRCRTFKSLVKLQPWFLSLQWKTCLWAELQPWCLSLKWRTCPWAEHWWWWYANIGLCVEGVCLNINYFLRHFAFHTWLWWSE